MRQSELIIITQLHNHRLDNKQNENGTYILHNIVQKIQTLNNIINTTAQF